MATTEDKFIAAIELGSSKVTGIAGRKQPDGAIKILAFAQEPSASFIRKGRINNVSKMTQCIINIKEKMERKMDRSISRVFVGIGGMGMHTVANTVVRNLDSKIQVTQPMIDAMCDENRNSTNSDRDILEAIPQEYRLGTQLTTEPVGVLAENVEGHYLNIVASSSVKEEIRNCFRNAGVAIADLPINVLSLADTMLSESEKRSGCVFVDMGAETTSVAVFKNNILRHLAVIPLGGANINRDIMSLQVEDDEAEELKLKYGSAVSNNEEGSNAPIMLRDGRTVSHEEFSGLVEARMEEIILNVKNQISLSKEQLIGGLIITGGASHMKDIDKAFVRDTDFEKIRFVRKARFTLRSADHDFNKDGDFNAVLALIDKGDENVSNCCGGPLGQPNQDLFEKPEEKKPELSPEEKAEEERRKAEEEKKRLEDERLEQERKEKEEEEKRKEEERRRRREERNRVFKRIGSFFEELVSAKKD